MNAVEITLVIIVLVGVATTVLVGMYLHKKGIDKVAGAAAGTAASLTLAAARTALANDSKAIADRAAQAAVDLAKKL